MEYDTYLVKCSGMVKGLFMQELQKGFSVSSHAGKSVHSFLTEDCGITSGYITDKIKTILIDGGPVDDIFNTLIKDGRTCAVSGAMPGIAGAMMRIGSPYAPMRDSITVRPGGSSEPEKDIIVELKLFNVVLSDMGPAFLKQGILISRKRVFELFTKHGDEIYTECRNILLNNSPVDMRKLTCEETCGLNEPVILKIETEDENNS